LTVDDGIAHAAAAARDRGHAACACLHEHDPEAFGLEAAPAIAAEHREHGGSAVEPRQPVVGDAPEDPRPPAEPACSASQARLVAAGAGDRDLDAVEPGDRLEQDVEALAGNQ